MADAISNTSPLLYLHHIEALDFLPVIFDTIWAPFAVVDELKEGRRRGFDVPRLENYPWLQIVDPQSVPSEWFSLDLGPGELAAMALALENKSRVVLLDDFLARRTAKAANIKVWGTLRVLLEAKLNGSIEKVEPYMIRLSEKGMWLSTEIRERMLLLARER